MSSKVVKIDNNLILNAKTYGLSENRSAEQQIIFWIKIGKIAQDNPDLTYHDITELLLGLEQVRTGLTIPYKL
jgi:hypothetical protein